MYGLTVGEIEGHIPTVPLLDRLSRGDPEALWNKPQRSLDLRDYAELAYRGGFPEPVLRLPGSERAVWLESYIEQLLTRDVAGLSARPDPRLLRRYLEACAINTAGVDA
jgi:predicted AAA+ superfamily ATPase